MESRIPPGSYFQYAPTGVHGSLQRSTSLIYPERYLEDLLAERQKLAAFLQILPVYSREIMRESGLLSNHVADLEILGNNHLFRSLGQHPNGGHMNMAAWNTMQTEEDNLRQKIILGPHGNSLKRVESMTECRIYIRGQGFVKDTLKEEKLKDKPGYEHLNEPLHIFVEAEFPEDIMDAHLDHVIAVLENLLKPVDESMDVYKKQQLRELAA
ncbi:hypothetical protein DH2020_020147 [Rehmannia glutinosa]|uniref:KHDC4/BBP-like KH-domain type I domain-containing protein n=1 Tax=Rehmannia glutinosa TaxID=99300 RepID=A0ABR0WFI1_REHGL